MAAGLQVFNSSGQIIFDTSDISYVIYGEGETTGYSGTINDDRIDENTFVIIYYIVKKGNCNVGDVYDVSGVTGGYGSFGGYGYPLFAISNGRISWAYNTSRGILYRYKFLYGGKPK